MWTFGHYKVLNRVLRHLEHTPHYVLELKCQSPDLLLGMVDSDFAGDPGTLRSTSGFLFTLGSGRISCRNPSRSQLLDELGFPQSGPTSLASGNSAAIQHAKHQSEHSRMKHIEVKKFILQGIIERDLVAAVAGALPWCSYDC